ncbi:MAG: hypothetical protein ABJM06_05235 [Gilvibacter sp.]
MDKQKIKQALIDLERHYLDESDMEYEDFLKGTLRNKSAIEDEDDQSHHVQSIEISDKIEEQAQIHVEHLNTINQLSFEPTEVVQPGAVVKVNGRYLVVAVSEPPFKVDGIDFLGISIQAPIYKELGGKKAGDSFMFNNMSFAIESVD